MTAGGFTSRQGAKKAETGEVSGLDREEMP
jgi:hypothetical protein